MKKSILPIVLIFLAHFTFSQTGPAGVGNSDGSGGQPENIIWLDASDLSSFSNGSTWADKSGNGFDAIHVGGTAPSLGTFLGGNNALRFAGVANENLVISDDNATTNKLDGASEFSVFAVFNSGSADTRAIISKRLNSGTRSWTVFYNNGFDMYGYAGTTTVGVNNGTGNVTATNPHISAMTVDASLSSSAVKLFVDGGLVQGTGSSISIPDRTEDITIGLFEAGDTRYFDGDLAEIIVFRNSLSGGERVIIENYLSQKYGISISYDYFRNEAGYDAAFQEDFRGIGTEDGSQKFATSGMSDALQIEEVNGSLNNANEYVLFAHDNTAHADGLTSDITVDPGVLDSHWARSWYVEATGSVAVSMRFDFGTAGLTYSGNPNDYVLLYRPTTSDDYIRYAVDSYSEENGDQLVVNISNADLISGYFTLGEGEQLETNDWYSYQSGDWNDPLTWTTISNGSLREPVSGGVPTSGDNVTILTGRTITMDSDDNDGVNLTVNGRLDIGNTSGHNFFNIAGNGVISMEGDASQNDNFPSGSTTLFADSIVGGTVEIQGAGLTLDKSHEFNNVILDLDNSTDIATLLANYQMNGDFTLESGVLQINDNSSTTSLEVTAYGNVSVLTDGEIAVGSANARHEFNFYGDFTNSGTAAFTNRTSATYTSEATDGIIDANFLSDYKDQTIDLYGTTNFYRIEIDKGNDQTYILDISASSASNFSLFGPANYDHGSVAQLTSNDNALGLLRGTVRLNANVDIPVLNNTGNYNISEAARLWVNGGSAEKPAGTAIVAYGTVQTSSGTLYAPINSGITTRDNGSIVVEGGTVTVNQIRTSVNGPTNIGGYTQSGGTVNVTGNNISTDYYAFSLTYPGNTFNMSGGTLRVAGAPTGTSTGGIFIASSTSNQSITGGTVIMEISRNDDFKLTSLAPFWNVIMRYTSGTGSQIDLIEGASGTGGNITNITTPSLRTLNDLTIESGVTFDHNGYDVEIGSDFNIENGGEYIYANNRKNTTTINGNDNSLLNFQNRFSTGAGDEQRFWNLVIDKPHNKTVSLASGKADLTGNNNNLIRVQGDYFKLLGGTLDQGFHSIRLYADTLINYDVLTVYKSANYGNDPATNSDNDVLKFRDDNQPSVIITADSSRFGAVKLNSIDEVITFNSNVKIDYLDYIYGRMNFQNHKATIGYIDKHLTKEAAFDLDGNGVIDVGPETKIWNPADMLITDGNASDGGLSLYISANGDYTFPIGVGIDADSLDRGTSKYTPAIVTVTNFSDDGYITIRPVDKVLSTTDASGGDILSYYWKVDYEGFTTEPTVEYEFYYYDDDLDGSANENNFLAGSVLENAPFTRDYEDSPVSENSSVHTGKNRIRFNGPDPDAGFTLVAGSYTAGQSGRFVGNVEVFYTKRYGSGYSVDWTDGTYWTKATNDIDGNGSVDSYEVHDSRQPNANDYPKAGDIAIVGWVPWGDPAGNNGKPHGIAMNSTQNMAELRFTPMTDISGNPSERVYAYNFQFRPTVVINPNGAFDPSSSTIISGEGLFWLRSTGGNQVDPDFSLVDFGSFAETDSSYLIYEATQNFTYNNIPSQVPNLMIAGDGWGANDRDFGIATDVKVNEDFELLGDVNLILSSGATGDITVDGDLIIFRNNAAGNESGGFGEIAYPNTASRSIEVLGDLKLNNQGAVVRVRSADGTVNQSVLKVHGNIEQNCSDGGTDGLQLYSGVGLDYIKLILTGVGNNSFINNSGDAPSLYNIEMNKGSDQTSSFTFNDNFTLNGPADAATKALDLKKGLFRINNAAINIDLSTGGGDFVIPSKSGLRISLGQANISGDDTGISLDGSLIIDGGILDMDDAVGNGNNFIEYSASGNAILEISSGTLNVGSQIRPITSANTGILKYRQTGGDVRIGTQSGPENTRGMLQIYNVGSEFTFTGGTLTIERHQSSPTIAALYLDPDDYNVTNTITLFNGNTPSGQNDFGINSTILLDGLEINGTNSPRAVININNLELGGNLVINSGATLDGNGIDLSLYSDFTNDGAFTPSNNTTSFIGTGTQTLSGTGSTSFYNLTKDNSGTFEVENAITINGYFVHNAGQINDNGNTIDIKGNAVLQGDHMSSGGNGLQFSGSAEQQIFRNTAGTSTLGVVTITNPTTVTIPDGNGYEFNIDGGLRLEEGVFSIGGAYIQLGESADIEEVNPFSVNNMIQTNSSFVDSGIGKVFASGYNQDFTFPVGRSYYTPVSFNFGNGGNTFGSTTGTITVKPSNEYHPVINDGDDNFGSGDINNVLQYYWSIRAEDVSGMAADMTLAYDDNLVLSDEGGYDESDYIAARILTFNNTTNDINKYDATSVDETNNLITFNFSGSTTNGITGDYFAGIDEAIPDNVVTYTAVSGGGDVDQEIYDIPLPSGAGVPPSGAVLIIPSGNTVTFNVDNVRLYKTEIQSGGVLEINNTSNHRLGVLEGTGVLKIVSDGVNANLPAFSGDFLSCSGGGLEYAGSGNYSILPGITALRSLTLSGSGSRQLSNNNITVCNDFELNGPTFNNSNNKNIDVSGDLNIASGTFNSNGGTLDVSGNLNLTGGTFDGNGAGSTRVRTDLNMISGTFNIGSGGMIYLYGDVNRTSATFNGGSGSARVDLRGTSSQQIGGDFSGSNAFYRLLVNNQGTSLNGDIEISNKLFLTKGIITTNGNNLLLGSGAIASPSSGNSNSYIIGKFVKTLPSAGSSFTFPIGGPTQWRPVTINNVSSGGLSWEAQYFSGSAASDPLVDNLTPTDPGIATISDGEYWKISDGNSGASGVTATIGLSWGMSSDVSDQSSEREEMEIMIWNDGSSSWDNLGGSNFSSGHTQNAGSFTASSSNSFSEHIYTLGSGDAENPLPVTLVNFDGKLSGSSVKLSWLTSSELNNDYFEVEHSLDGVIFHVIGKVKGHGNSTEPINYSMFHERPATGYNFYRLKQVDFDGTATVEGKVVSVFVEDNSQQFEMIPTPNPTNQENIQIKLVAGNGSITIELFDIFGAALYKESIMPEDINGDQFKLQITKHLNSGIYLIKVQQGIRSVSKRVMIKE